jgi:hypothetical protein
MMDYEHWRGVGQTAVVAVAAVALLILVLWFSIARYDECRTEHPWWYCVSR